jgi:hypothetical protein
MSASIQEQASALVSACGTASPSVVVSQVFWPNKNHCCMHITWAVCCAVLCRASARIGADDPEAALAFGLQAIK